MAQAKQLAPLAQMQGLKILNLEGNQIGDAGARAGAEQLALELAPAFAQMQGLERLELDGNQIGGEMKSKLRAELARVETQRL